MPKAIYEKVIRLIYGYDRSSDGSAHKKAYMKEIKECLKPFVKSEA